MMAVILNALALIIYVFISIIIGYVCLNVYMLPVSRKIKSQCFSF